MSLPKGAGTDLQLQSRRQKNFGFSDSQPYRFQIDTAFGLQPGFGFIDEGLGTPDNLTGATIFGLKAALRHLRLGADREEKTG